jgi:hypothetical protein
MRHEIQSQMRQEEVDAEYVASCMGALLRSHGWRQLHNARGQPYRSFIRFCLARRPHGLGLSQKEVKALIDLLD